MVRLAKATNDSMTGTSMSTPTTVARAAPDSSPKRLIATATASSKKLDVPISAAGKDVIGLGAGEPDFDTPWHIREAGMVFLAIGALITPLNFLLIYTEFLDPRDVSQDLV